MGQLLGGYSPEVRQQVANILNTVIEAYESESYDWIGWPRSTRSDAYVEDLTCDIFWVPATGFTLPGIVKRVTVMETGGKCRIPAYHYLVDRVTEALTQYIMSTTVWISYIGWANHQQRTKEEILVMLRQVAREVTPTLAEAEA